MNTKKIRYFVMDVDGTLTDGKIYTGTDGECCKAFHVRDGYGIRNILIPQGITPIIITGRSSRILEQRCRELGITELYQGISHKREELLKQIQENELCHVAYIGDDINDLPVMEAVHKAGGIVACPKDSVNAVLCCADYICEKDGGCGAVREFIDLIVGEGK